MDEARVVIGVDIGGTGVKAAAVDLATGALQGGRHEVPTPVSGDVDEITAEVAGLVQRIRDERDGGVHERLGIAVPGVVRDGVMRTSANLAPEWVGTDVASLFTRALGAPCVSLNDADAAGVAERAYGAAAGRAGTTLVLTFGTGIGSALFRGDVLVPNLELGHLELDGHRDIERYASAKAIEREGLSLAEWAARAAQYLRHVEMLFAPDLIVLSGGISGVLQKVLPFDGLSTPVVPAHFLGDAGIVGAARNAAEPLR